MQDIMSKSKAHIVAMTDHTLEVIVFLSFYLRMKKNSKKYHITIMNN